MAREESMDRKEVTVASGSGVEAEESIPPPTRGKGKGSEAGITTSERKEINGRT